MLVVFVESPSLITLAADDLPVVPRVGEQVHTANREWLVSHVKWIVSNGSAQANVYLMEII